MNSLANARCRWNSVQNHKRVRCLVSVPFLLTMLGLAVVTLPAVGQDFTLSDFNLKGFQYTFDGFNQTIGSTTLRLNDPVDGWGGAGRSIGTWDLSSYANGRFSVDLIKETSTGAELLEVELIDGAGNSGKWPMSVSSLTAGVPSNLVSTTTLGNPLNGIGDFQNLDLADIKTWQILGEFGGANPFDISFDNLVASNTVAAPPPYPGHEPNAPWRTTAAAQIEANRKADLQINVTDATGIALTGADIAVRMQQYEFGFGSAVQAWRLRDSNPAHDTYKQKIGELFNVATLENNLKWPPWDGEWGSLFTQQGAQDAITWLQGQSIDIHGHTLVWPGLANLPSNIQAMLASPPLDATEQQALRDAIAAHIADVGGAVAGDVVSWDVVNEPRANHDVMDALFEGDLAMSTWFNQAASVDPNARLFLNEFGIITSAGGTDTANQQQFFDTIQLLQNNGAPIDGLGIQGHFSTNNLTGPEDLWTIFDRFEQLGLDMQISEFDFSTTDEQLQADYTRDILTAAFAHSGMDAFIMWGFWEDATFIPNAELFRSDWSIKPNGQAYLDLVLGDWWTDADLLADALGSAMVRGFKGEYEITVTINGQVEVFTITLAADGTVNLALNQLAADFNGDGTVDNLDLVSWNLALGSTAGGDADGDGDTDGADFLIWQQQFGLSAGLPAVAAVPEPSSLCMLVAGTMLFGFYRRKK